MTAATVLERMAQWLGENPEAEAGRQDEATWTVSALMTRAEQVARGLRDKGVAPGDRVAWWGPPSLDFAAALLGIWRADATYLGINPRYTAREVDVIVTRARPTVILTGTQVPEALADGRVDAGVLARVVGMDLMLASRALAPVPEATGTWPALLVFTTGSTGTPKAALLSHAAVAAASRHQADATERGSRHTINALPSNHIGGLVNVTTAAWWGRQSLVFVPVFSPAAIAEVLRALPALRLPAVPMLLRRCLEDPGFVAAAPGRLCHVLSGGAPLPRAVHDDLVALGVHVQGMYGQTELSGSVCFTAWEDTAGTTSETIGRPHPGVRVRLGPVDGAPGDLDEGELQVLGPQVFDGYLDDLAATRAAFTPDGWLRSGDLARRRPDGALQLTGRLKELINTRGFKVMPGEVEAVLLEHPQVSSVAVVGTPDAASGEAIVAFVTVRAPAPPVSALVAWCRERLAHYKVPRTIHTLGALPLLGVGKVDKRLLAAIAAGGSHE